jgi:hypothetical protein
LALLDGRSIYQDFFGFVMWDFLPVNLNEIKQVEVVRGPASAVWGANAFNGVVNVITKSPREMAGTSAVIGFGAFGTDRPGRCGLTLVCERHPRAGRERPLVVQAVGWRVLAGSVLASDRPDPCDRPEVCGGARASYPGFTNQGTTQPKFDARADYDFVDGRKLSFSGGIAGTDGIMHTGIGPFDIDSGTVMAYGKASYADGALRANALQQHPPGRRHQPPERQPPDGRADPLRRSRPTPTISTSRTCRRSPNAT